jgi:hypothetical protein
VGRGPGNEQLDRATSPSIDMWVLDNGASSHMMRMRSMFLSVSETGSDLHVRCGASTMHAVNGVGCVRFQLESGGSLEVAEVLFVPEQKVNFLSVSALEDLGYTVMFEDGHVLLCLEGADTQDAAVRLGIREGMMHRVLGQPIVGSKGILDCRSDQSATKVAGGSSNSEGAATTTVDLMGSKIDLGGGSSKSTFLIKREC